jgi:hypothetical protein
VQPKPLRGLIHEAERPEPVHRGVRVVARHRRENAPRHSARHRRGVKESAALVIETGTERGRQSGDHARPDLVDRHVGDVGLRGEPQGQRVTPRDAADPVGVVFRHVRVGEECARGLIAQPDEREDLEPTHSTALGRPLDHRSVTPRDDEAQVRRH